jgi:hypothetical protein
MTQTLQRRSQIEQYRSDSRLVSCWQKPLIGHHPAQPEWVVIVESRIDPKGHSPLADELIPQRSQSLAKVFYVHFHAGSLPHRCFMHIGKADAKEGHTSEPHQRGGNDFTIQSQDKGADIARAFLCQGIGPGLMNTAVVELS